MRIDEFALTADSNITAPDRLRVSTVGFDIVLILVILCIKHLSSFITDAPFLHSCIEDEGCLNSPITKEIKLDGNLCW